MVYFIYLKHKESDCDSFTHAQAHLVQVKVSQFRGTIYVAPNTVPVYRICLYKRPPGPILSLWVITTPASRPPHSSCELPPLPIFGLRNY